MCFQPYYTSHKPIMVAVVDITTVTAAVEEAEEEDEAAAAAGEATAAASSPTDSREGIQWKINLCQIVNWSIFKDIFKFYH